ncbi:hypothetical protein JB92DRAFT_3148416 [Gautieria morchelliformis]|nr:hypothetical protein JB92DRAFT_3148416 [Gautieria morchelliformis]
MSLHAPEYFRSRGNGTWYCVLCADDPQRPGWRLRHAIAHENTLAHQARLEKYREDLELVNRCCDVPGEGSAHDVMADRVAPVGMGYMEDGGDVGSNAQATEVVDQGPWGHAGSSWYTGEWVMSNDTSHESMAIQAAARAVGSWSNDYQEAQGADEDSDSPGSLQHGGDSSDGESRGRFGTARPWGMHQFPQSAQTAGNGAEYLRCQESGPPYLRQDVAPSGEIDWTTLSYAALIDYFSVQDTGHMSANTSCSYDSGGDDYPDGGPNMPTIGTKHSYYNQGDAWTTTATPPAAKNVASLMAGSRAMQPDPVPDSPSRVTANMRGTQLEDGSAGIAGPEKGKTKAKRGLSDGPEVLCPEGCMLHGQARTYVRRDTLRKHLMESCKGRIGDKPRLDAKAIEVLVVKAFPFGRKSRRRT